MADTAPSPRVALALKLSALALVLRPVGDPAVRAGMLAIAAAALLFPRCLRHPLAWAALAGLAALRVVLDWPFPDNHAYLLAYWCLAAALALAGDATDACLAWNARHLLGLVFALAAGWKLVSPDYLDGSFLAVTSLRDARFEGVARLLTGFGAAELAEVRDVLAAHVDGLPPGAAAGVALPERLHFAAAFVSASTLALEAAIALLFLWPVERGPSRLRDAALLLFCATTYAVATVEGFAWLLLAMGVAQCAPERRLTRAAYVACFGLVLVYTTLPWTHWLAERLLGPG